jgi:hypothetical protein
MTKQINYFHDLKKKNDLETIFQVILQSQQGVVNLDSETVSLPEGQEHKLFPKF